jgi:TatA/E family protein of Tat protein translocase
MFGHFPELIIILVIALIVFGPEKLPEVASNVGKMVREARAIMDTAMNGVDEAVPDDFSSYYYESLSRAGEDVPESFEPDDAYHTVFDLDDTDDEDEEEGATSPSGRRMVTRVVQPRTRPPASSS